MACSGCPLERETHKHLLLQPVPPTRQVMSQDLDTSPSQGTGCTYPLCTQEPYRLSPLQGSAPSGTLLVGPPSLCPSSSHPWECLTPLFFQPHHPEMCAIRHHHCSPSHIVRTFQKGLEDKKSMCRIRCSVSLLEVHSFGLSIALS